MKTRYPIVDDILRCIDRIARTNNPTTSRKNMVRALRAFNALDDEAREYALEWLFSELAHLRREEWQL